MLTAKSHSVKKEELEQLRRNAIDEDRLPCYVIEYQGRRWFMIDEERYEELKWLLKYTQENTKT